MSSKFLSMWVKKCTSSLKQKLVESKVIFRGQQKLIQLYLAHLLQFVWAMRRCYWSPAMMMMVVPVCLQHPASLWHTAWLGVNAALIAATRGGDINDFRVARWRTKGDNNFTAAFQRLLPPPLRNSSHDERFFRQSLDWRWLFWPKHQHLP